MCRRQVLGMIINLKKGGREFLQNVPNYMERGEGGIM